MTSQRRPIRRRARALILAAVVAIGLALLLQVAGCGHTIPPGLADNYAETPFDFSDPPPCDRMEPERADEKDRGTP